MNSEYIPSETFVQQLQDLKPNDEIELTETGRAALARDYEVIRLMRCLRDMYGWWRRASDGKEQHYWSAKIVFVTLMLLAQYGVSREYIEQYLASL